MSDINETQVIIAGKVLTLTGYETAEYTQKVANYINKKLEDCKATASFKAQNKEMQMLLVALNIADDYMKVHERITEVETIIKDKDKEIYNLKHDIVTTQSRLDKADEQVRTLQDKMAESSKKLIQLDAKLRSKEKEEKTEKVNEEKKAERSTGRKTRTRKAETEAKSAEDIQAENAAKNAEDTAKTETVSKTAEDRKPEVPNFDEKRPGPAVKAEEKKTEDQTKTEAAAKPAEDKKEEAVTTSKPAEEKKEEPAKTEDKKEETPKAEDKKPEADIKSEDEKKSESDDKPAEDKKPQFIYKQESLFKYDAPKPVEPRLVKDNDKKSDNRGPVQFPFNKK